MHVRILGSAAGGGVPQWNCACPNCSAARAGSPHVRPRTQSSVAVSADGQAWFLLNVSPDIRQQAAAFDGLGPPPGRQRGTGIAGCLLTDAELDHVTGLLLLREGPAPTVFCTGTVRRWLSRALPVEQVLAGFGGAPWADLPLDVPVDLPLPQGELSGLRVRAFEVDRHVPRFVTEKPASPPGSVIGLAVHDTRTGGTLLYAPCVGSLGPALTAAAREADGILLDGTFWSDDEPTHFGLGRTARQMGHLPVGGPDGSLGWLAGLSARERVYVHINNTNPMLDESGPEHALVRERGVRVGADGDAFDL